GATQYMPEASIMVAGDDERQLGAPAGVGGPAVNRGQDRTPPPPQARGGDRGPPAGAELGRQRASPGPRAGEAAARRAQRGRARSRPGCVTVYGVTRRRSASTAATMSGAAYANSALPTPVACMGRREPTWLTTGTEP